MTSLKLLALDNDDLSVISAHMQDAVFRISDMSFQMRPGLFSLAANRFVWEDSAGRRKAYERRRALLSFKRVSAVRSIGFDRANGDNVLSLLAVRYRAEGEGPEGVVELVLSGGGMIALDVECIEAQLADTGGAWETNLKPGHPGD
ncbi:DUF2948 family protein [Rhizobium sp. S95]|uniref:DUF2948 family protein n=1 Tax=Ciceribacter sichuanensis TaxID=2949647 RepID=A0AAJ1F8J8_9HYPH|nr:MULTISPECIES: DUF2948 family protein [unclassified Ciceribacter]MCM2396745.1 DUF2948 family protein [Ciceribacter sp. S95]MCO5958163.1 DUF2948 family protein [Ciceribacter sp. S101]